MLRSVCIVVLLFIKPDYEVRTSLPIYKCEEYTYPEFSKESLKHYIYEIGILHPEIVYAQAVLETGNFTSPVFKENCNLFGMKLARKRRTLAVGKNRNHAVYTHWTECVEDYLLWQQQFKVTPVKTKNDYYHLLDKVYAEDGKYSKKLKRIK